MAIQNSVTLEHRKGFKGQIVDLQLANKISILNTTDEVWEYGTPVNYPDTDEFAGFVARTITDTSMNPALGAGVKPQRTATVLTDGVIYIEAPADVEIGDAVEIDGAAIEGAKYVSAGAAGDLVKVSLNIGG